MIARLLCAGIACLVGIGIPTLGLAFWSREAPEKDSGRTLTFAERVAYQRAIEEVYWRHRIWPKENAQSKPSLDTLISRAQIERKVEVYLRKSQSIVHQRGRPIAASELQSEMERMASHSTQRNILRELFAALGKDPFVIAECLARPILAERLGSELSNIRHDREDAARPKVAPYHVDRAYELPEIASMDCTDDTWTATSTMNAPDARWGHTAVWTGSEMIVWGGNDAGNTYFNTGGRYNPATDSWASTSTINAPTVRWLHSAVWTGSEMVVWGGYSDATGEVSTGGRYNPVTDSWIATSTATAPTARVHHTAIWTGAEMIVFGGYGCNGNCVLHTGGRYSPSTDSWAAITTIDAPQARWYHTAIWTGSEMVIWGGTNGTNYLHTGGKYNPSTDSWTATGTVNVALGRVVHTAVWTGAEMIVWGGVDETFNDTNTGGKYNPGMDSWTDTSLANAPSPRDSHSAVWTGSEMIIWGGTFCCPGIDFDNGGRYNAGTDGWTTTNTADAPHARDSHTAVWTGNEMIVWGGGYFVGSNFIPLNTGGRYCAQSGATPTPTPTSTPTATPTATATPSPSPTVVPRMTPAPRNRPTPAPRP